MNRNLTLCDNCVGKIVLSLETHVERQGLCVCSEQCTEAFFSPENINDTPSGLAHDLGVEE